MAGYDGLHTVKQTLILCYEHKNFSNTKSLDNLPRSNKPWIISSTFTTFSTIFVQSAISSLPTRLRFWDWFAYASSVTNLKLVHWKTLNITWVFIQCTYVHHYNLQLVYHKLTYGEKCFRAFFLNSCLEYDYYSRAVWFIIKSRLY